MYRRWVPLLSGGLHCVQPAPRQRTAHGNPRNTAVSPHTTLNRPGTRHTVFTVENGEWEGTGTNGNEENTPQKKSCYASSR